MSYELKFGIILKLKYQGTKLESFIEAAPINRKIHPIESCHARVVAVAEPRWRSRPVQCLWGNYIYCCLTHTFIDNFVNSLHTAVNLVSKCRVEFYLEVKNSFMIKFDCLDWVLGTRVSHDHIKI